MRTQHVGTIKNACLRKPKTSFSASPSRLKLRRQSPGLGGGQLLEVLQGRRHVEQLLVEDQGEVEVHHSGVVDGQTADYPDQVKPVLLDKTLETHRWK